MNSDKTIHLFKMVLLILLIVIAVFGIIFETIMILVKPIEVHHISIWYTSLGLLFIGYKGILLVLNVWKTGTIQKVVELCESEI